MSIAANENIDKSNYENYYNKNNAGNYLFNSKYTTVKATPIKVRHIDKSAIHLNNNKYVTIEEGKDTTPIDNNYSTPGSLNRETISPTRKNLENLSRDVDKLLERSSKIGCNAGSFYGEDNMTVDRLGSPNNRYTDGDNMFRSCYKPQNNMFISSKDRKSSPNQRTANFKYENEAKNLENSRVPMSERKNQDYLLDSCNRLRGKTTDIKKDTVDICKKSPYELFNVLQSSENFDKTLKEQGNLSLSGFDSQRPSHIPSHNKDNFYHSNLFNSTCKTKVSQQFKHQMDKSKKINIDQSSIDQLLKKNDCKKLVNLTSVDLNKTINLSF